MPEAEKRVNALSYAHLYQEDWHFSYDRVFESGRDCNA